MLRIQKCKLALLLGNLFLQLLYPLGEFCVLLAKGSWFLLLGV